jgi:ascorbate-specific PTS system EIIC-type component UlaA
MFCIHHSLRPMENSEVFLGFMGMTIPIISIIVTGAVLWKFFDSRHKANMAMIEKGIAPSETPKQARPVGSSLRALKLGLLALFVGIGMFVGTQLEDYYGMSHKLVPACMLIAGGLGLSIYYFIAGKAEEAQRAREEKTL